MATAATIGAGYFLWRYHYFGLLLPLPLIVKAGMPTWYEGLIQNIRAINYYPFLLFPLFFPSLKANLSPAARRTITAALAASASLFVALAFAHQSQNVAGRFQFPIIFALVVTYLLAMQHAPRDRTTRIVMLFLIPAIAIAQNTTHIGRSLRIITNRDYINTFPWLLHAEGFRPDVIALTEAGRFPYWVNAPTMIDLIGLNSPQMLRHDARAVLETTHPDLVFVHHAGRYDTAALDPAANIVAIPAEQIGLLPASNTTPVQTTPEAALVYAQSRHETAIFVRYRGKLDHVYFLAPSLDQPLFLATLGESFRVKLSYLSTEKARRKESASQRS